MTTATLPSLLLFGVGAPGRRMAASIAEASDEALVLCLALRFPPGGQGVRCSADAFSENPRYKGASFTYTSALQLFEAIGYGESSPAGIVFCHALGGGLHIALLDELVQQAEMRKVPFYLLALLPPRVEDSLLDLKVKKQLAGWSRFAAGVLVVDVMEAMEKYKDYTLRLEDEEMAGIAQRGLVKFCRFLATAAFRPAFGFSDDYFGQSRERGRRCWRVSLVRVAAG